MNNEEINVLTRQIIKGYYTVYNRLGYGFLEQVYERSLLLELRKAGLDCQNQLPVPVFYDSGNVGHYFADIIVEDKVIVELKAAEQISEGHEKQLINYLGSTNIEVGLLMNFGKTPQFKRKIFNNELKRYS